MLRHEIDFPPTDLRHLTRLPQQLSHAFKLDPRAFALREIVRDAHKTREPATLVVQRRHAEQNRQRIPVLPQIGPFPRVHFPLSGARRQDFETRLNRPSQFPRQLLGFGRQFVR